MKQHLHITMCISWPSSQEFIGKTNAPVSFIETFSPGETLAFIINHEDARMLADSTLKGSTRDKDGVG